MKRVNLALVAGGCFFSCVCAVYAESSVTATPKVQIAGKQGDTDAYIGPVYFPDFKDTDSARTSDAPCADKLKGLSNKKMYPLYINENGFEAGSEGFLRHGWKYCCKRDETGACNSIPKKDSDKGVVCKGIDVESAEERPGKITVGEDDYYDLKDLFGELEIKPGYRRQGKILFSWTVRVEGFNPEDVDHYTGEMVNGIAVWPVLCERWRGTSQQAYSGGQVKTQLYVAGVKIKEGKEEDEDGYAAVGEPVEMTVPAHIGKVGVVSHMPPLDPTLTGSFLLTPGDFPDSELPLVISYKLKWCNHSAIRIKSPAGQRGLGYEHMPVTQK